MDRHFKDGAWPFGYAGESKDVPVPSGNAIVQISKILGRADEQVGEYSFGGQAKPLPAALGLAVDGVGSIPVPITEERAQKLMSVCEKASSGDNLDVKKDENVQSAQLSFDNMMWQDGIAALTATIADRLGYPDITLESKLYKLQISGEQGHFVRNLSTEREDDAIATLVIQLPSAVEGGDLVIRRGGEMKKRHDFGKSEGTAAFLPHYAIHYPDAEHTVEMLTKGYRLALLYSLHLPVTMRHREKSHDVPLSEDLASAIISMDLEDDFFALLLSHENTSNNMKRLGIKALTGIDNVIVHALEEANTFVPADRKLKFFLVRLTHQLCHKAEDIFDRQGTHSESMRWYDTSGECLGNVSKSTLPLNFLNPTRETLGHLWGRYAVSIEDKHRRRTTEYAPYAIVAWPAAQHEEKAMAFMPVDAAIEAVYARKSIDGETLRKLLCDIGAKLDAIGTNYNRDELSVKSCRLICEMLVDAGNSELVKQFFKDASSKSSCLKSSIPVFAPPFGRLENNHLLVPAITKIVRTFDWNDYGSELLHRFGCWNEMEMALRVADGLETGAAQDALLQKAVCLVRQDKLFSSKAAWIFVKWAIRGGRVYVAMFSEIDPSLLGPVVEQSLPFLGSISTTSNGSLVDLVAILPKRIQWLTGQIELLDKPFSWKMPDAKFAENPKVEAFLRGPDFIMKVTKGMQKFKSFQDANNYAAKWTREDQVNASFETEASSMNADAVVTITKTRKWFEERQRRLLAYKAELNRLQEHCEGHCEGDTNGGDEKRVRLE
ncbi:putative Fe2OG dioxygenase domain-containing protein [Phytophthora infestans]|nr:putative Fe2OG dioxygenase domain-containing protein [Phytophthora infestans]